MVVAVGEWLLDFAGSVDNGWYRLFPNAHDGFFVRSQRFRWGVWVLVVRGRVVQGCREHQGL